MVSGVIVPSAENICPDWNHQEKSTIRSSKDLTFSVTFMDHYPLKALCTRRGEVVGFVMIPEAGLCRVPLMKPLNRLQNSAAFLKSSSPQFTAHVLSTQRKQNWSPRSPIPPSVTPPWLNLQIAMLNTSSNSHK